jgi:peptidoglycan/LPS O-acetylase OafA/YrhL
VRKKSRYIPEVDGLRGLAVIAVLLYHLGVSWIPGGFLGVDLFFVISGYVITRLILDSIESNNGLDLRGFYIARFRRLYPALLLVIVSSALLIALAAPDAIHRFLGDIPYILLGLNNWRLVLTHQDYFQAIGRPPLLQHTWSLAVEAQFYAIWPLILYVIWKRFGKKRIIPISILIAFISGVALFLLSVKIDTASSLRTSHIYFGTDTHSLGLFLGSALAVSWVPQNFRSTISQRAQDFVDGIGVFGFLGLLSAFLFISEKDPTLYRLAFPIAAIAGCATIASVVHPASRFAPLMRSRTLLWIGERSYGMYLWHWVIFEVMRPGIDLTGSLLAINIARTLIVFALADLSLRYIERPIRRGELARWFRGIKYQRQVIRIRQKTLVAGVALLMATTMISSSALAIYRDDRARLRQQIEMTHIDTPMHVFPQGIWLTGDSVILGIRSKLSEHKTIALTNARVGRQIDELINVVRKDQPFVPSSTVVLDLGNNNRLTATSIRELFDLLAAQPRIILVNTAVPRLWKDENDQLISQVAQDYPQVTVIDWNHISEGHPEYFVPDGVHLTDIGSDVYVAAILTALKS